MTRPCRILITVAGFLTLATTPGRAQETLPPESRIQEILAERMATRPAAGVVVGMIDTRGERRLVAHGTSGTDRPLDGRSVFEIGSITKVFTAVLLAGMAEAGAVALDDPVATWLPDGMRALERDGRSVTLLDLATHTSGLPRLPAGFTPADPGNPYADYTPERLYSFLSSYALTRAPGERYEYSNLGMGLLGHALARQAGTSYERLVTERVLEPLGLSDTRITLGRDLEARLVTGHDVDGRPASNWDIPTLAGAGALRSTADDMLSFLLANLSPSASPLGPVLLETHAERARTPSPEMAVGLAWHRLRRPSGRVIVWHNGGTGGYHSFIGFDPVGGVGVVVLAGTAADIDDIGFHLLDPSFPLAVPAPAPAETHVATEVLDEYVGEYEVAPQFVLTITREGDELFLQATGQPRFRIYAQSETEFVLRAVDASVVFTRDTAGNVTGLVLHQAGREIPARRR